MAGEGMTARRRIAAVDLARGSAVALMIGYHFCFDLNYYGLLHIDFNHAPVWLGLRAFIVTLFLLVAGVSLRLAHGDRLHWRAIGRRLALLATAAALVSLGSYLLFPRSYIFFGVLHFIALASVLALPLLRYDRLNLLLGVGCLLLGTAYNAPLFDTPALQWVGLMTHKPITEDYVPLLPWFGVVLLGLFLGRRLPAAVRRFDGRGRALAQPLLWAGRHSLPIYLVHQPLLLGALYLATRVR